MLGGAHHTDVCNTKITSTLGVSEQREKQASEEPEGERYQEPDFLILWAPSAAGSSEAW
jgi:hypothetical protein